MPTRYVVGAIPQPALTGRPGSFLRMAWRTDVRLNWKEQPPSESLTAKVWR
jgi:hypothetical protein